MAYEGGVVPVFVLTKADLCDDPAPYLDALRAIAPSVPVVTLDTRDPGAAAGLAIWCGPGQTVALLGSSGVGKSTLATTLTGAEIATQGIREGDAKGLIDTPGMRELQLAGTNRGIETVFEDIAELAAECKFSNCAHETEPGCAVKRAIEQGALAPERLERWRKLKREDARNTESVAGAHAKSRAFGRLVRQVKEIKPR